MITSIHQLDLTKQYTYADYLTWKIDEKVELINGRIAITPPVQVIPSENDVLISLLTQINTALQKTAYRMFSQPFTVWLNNPHDDAICVNHKIPVQPDICVVKNDDNLQSGSYDGAPEWIVEIVSPGCSKAEVKDKFDLYQQNGVKEYWIAYPLYMFIQVFDLINNKFTLPGTYINEKLQSNTFGDLQIDLTAVFKL